MRRVAVLLVMSAVALGLVGCAGRTGAGVARATPDPQPTVRMEGHAAVIGELPERHSVLIHGTAPLAPLDRYTKQDLTTLARGEGKDPDVVLRDYATQPAFDAAVETARSDARDAYAVYRPGVHAAPELRFTARPPSSLLDALRAAYPRDLRIEWGERLAGDDAREEFSESVFGIVTGLTDAGHASTGIDGDGRLDVEFDGTATPRKVAQEILETPSFRRLPVDGAPPTQIRVTHVHDATITAA